MDDKSIIEKIRKLLALSKSPNRAEAAAALNKANELLIQYNLTMDQVRMSSADVDPVGMRGIYCAVKKRWRTLLLDKIADVNLCAAIFFKKLDKIADVNLCAAIFFKKYVLVVGREVNAISVEVMWDYLEKVVQRIHLRECPRQAKSHYRESFKLGIASGISEKLEEQFQINTDPTQVNALVLYQNEKNRITNFLNNYGISYTTSRIEVERRDAYQKGLVHGRRVNLDKQIPGQARSTRVIGNADQA